ncbi:MAG: hypothetical protein M1820_000457 [Bogoriella megaspora]|nr:MAG: hypothetical protein M1820_000457 [Bogoriella megaspora]
MAIKKVLAPLILGLYALGSTALPENHTDALVNAAIDAGTFANPSKNVRPRFRYWVPDASVDPDTLADDVRQAGVVGAGGVEILGYYLYGGTAQGTGTFAPDDWSIYGWGTPAWQSAFNTLLQAHVDNDLIVDFALGPNQGQGVPAPEHSEGLAWDLYSYNISVPIGGTYDDIIPGWSIGKLQAVVSGLVSSSVNVTVPPGPSYGGSGSLNATGTYPSLPGDQPFNRTQVTLAASSLQDLTDQVGPNGRLTYTFPSNSTGEGFTLFVIYLIHSDYRAQQDPELLGGPQTAPQTFLQNGSWAVDHFSVLGAQTITNFWEQYVLTNGTKELLMSVGNYGWEDSIELRENIFWTENYTSHFQGDHGYDITKYLPILFHQNTLGFGTEPPVWWITDEADFGNSHIADYRETLTNLYGFYVEALNQWHHDYLDVQFSAQVSYNLAMDMLQNVPNVDAPECESLGFNHLIDGYRQYCGPANLAGKRLVSTECGANVLEAYQETLPELLFDVKRSIAGSVTQFVFHGFPYSGPYGNTTWPGFTTFNDMFAEMHGPRQPAWAEFYQDTMNFTARLSYIFQSGIPKMDLAFYMKITTFPSIVRNYLPTDLEEAGYAYEYISPENFGLPEAYVSNGVYAPNRQAFKAMIIRANDSMTVNGTEEIAKLANEGLPIVFSGGLPIYVAQYEPRNGTATVSSVLQSITSLPNVHVVPYDNLADSVASLGIQPLTSIKSNGSWFTYWRRDDLVGADYVFVYNDGQYLGLGNGYSEGTVEFASTGTPYFLDAWTGQQIPIANFTRSNHSTTIPFQLAGNQSIIVAFADSNSSILCSTSQSNSTGSPCAPSNSINDPSRSLPTAAGPVQNLTNWTLVVEQWDPPSNLSNIVPSATVKYNTTHQLSSLTSWADISGIGPNVSGRGYYNTTFTWPPSSAKTPSSHGGASNSSAYIDFGAIFHTIRVRINGETLPPLDLTWAKADITPYLKQGENEVEAVVSTPLLNVLRPIWDQLLSSGAGPAIPANILPVQDYGLLMPVSVVPY